MATNTLVEPRRTWFRLPHPLWILSAAIGIIIVSVVLRLGLPICLAGTDVTDAGIAALEQPNPYVGIER